MNSTVRHPIVLILFLSVFVNPVKSETKPRGLLKKFSSDIVSQALIPRDQWSPFPRSPEEWQKTVSKDLIKEIISRGESANGKPFASVPATATLEFSRSGNRTAYEKISFPKRGQLWSLVLAESIEGKGRFVDSIINGIWSICEETSWGGSAHMFLQDGDKTLQDAEEPYVDLFAAETAATLAWTDYFVGPALDKVSPRIRKRIQYEVNRRIFIPLREKKYGYLVTEKPNNWSPWIMSNYLAAVLLLEKDEKLRNSDVNRSISYVDHYLDGREEDGSCDEGPGYWFAATGCVLDFLNLLESATDGKIQIYQDPLIQRMGAFIYKVHIADNYFVNIGDAHLTIHPDGLMIHRYGRLSGDKIMKEFGSWIVQHQKPELTELLLGQHFQKTRSLFNLRDVEECLNPKAAEPEPASYWLPDLQLMTARTHSGLFVSSHGFHNGKSHNHNDVGDFIVYADGQPVIVDLGSGQYTARTFGENRYSVWFNTSPFHNLPTINGFEEKSGREYQATEVKYEKSEKVSSLFMNIAQAFPLDAKIKEWKRKVSVEIEGNVRIDEEYEIASEVKTLTQTFMTACEVDLKEEGKIIFRSSEGPQVCLTYDPDQWQASVEKIELKAPEDQPFKRIWNDQVKRVLLTNKSHQSKGTTSYVIKKI